MPRAQRILLIEDEHDTRVAVRGVLEQEGYLVSSAAHGLDALAMLRTGEKFHLIILDLMLPLMSGQELLRTIRLDPALNEIPVVIYSANASSLDGTCCWLMKPASVDEILAKTKLWIRKVS